MMRERIHGPAIDRYVEQDPATRRPQLPLLGMYVSRGADSGLVADTYGLRSENQQRSVRRWCREFLEFAALFVNGLEEALQAIDDKRAERWRERRILKDELDGYCEMTHRRSTGGGTPGIEHMARACPTCALKAALFGRPGWGG